MKEKKKLRIDARSLLVTVPALAMPPSDSASQRHPMHQHKSLISINPKKVMIHQRLLKKKPVVRLSSLHFIFFHHASQNQTLDHKLIVQDTYVLNRGLSCC